MFLTFFKRCLSWVLSKSDPYDFIFQTWVMSLSSAVQKADKSGWWSSFRLGPSGFYFCVVLTFFFVEHTSLGFGYVWIQYLIDLGENKIQGSQACRILLGSMVGIYWIYALFGGSPFFGAEKDAARTRHKKEKHYGLWLPDYTILLLQSLKYIFKNWVWICLDSTFDRFWGT